MIENELKRIADALEAIAIALQPNSAAVPPAQPAEAVVAEAPKSKKQKAEKSVPVLPEAEDITPDPSAAVATGRELTQDEVIEAVQRAVKVNRDATLAICKKYGYEKSLKDITADKYDALAAELESVK